MVNLLKFTLVLAVLLFRLFLILNVIMGLYLNHKYPDSNPLSNINWYIYAMILDFYCSRISNKEEE
jgi:hypothetical protein